MRERTASEKELSQKEGNALTTQARRKFAAHKGEARACCEVAETKNFNNGLPVRRETRLRPARAPQRATIISLVEFQLEYLSYNFK